VEYIPPETTADNILKQFGPGVQIKVYKVVRGLRQYCGYLTTWSNIEEDVAALGFGSGEYSISILEDGEVKHVMPLGIAEKVMGAVATSGDPSLRVLLDQMARLIDRLANPPQREREPVNDLADALVKMHGMVQQPQSTQLTPATIMEWIQLGKELAGSPGGGGDDLWSVLKEIGAPIIQGVMAARNGQQVNPQQIAAPQQQSEGQMRAMLEAKLKLGIMFLKKKALAGSDPELYVDLIVDNRESEDYATLIHTILNGVFSAFIQIDPVINREPFEQFFRAVYDGVRSVFTQKDSVEAAVTGPKGNNGNISHNGSNGAKRGK